MMHSVERSRKIELELVPVSYKNKYTCTCTGTGRFRRGRRSGVLRSRDDGGRVAVQEVRQRRGKFIEGNADEARKRGRRGLSEAEQRVKEGRVTHQLPARKLQPQSASCAPRRAPPQSHTWSCLAASGSKASM